RRVMTVYGPVATWQEELPLHDPTRLPPDTVTLRCETLVVSEDPLAARALPPGGKKIGPIELQAIENVEIEGRTKDQGVFQAEGVKASYNEAKDLLVLDGDGQREAILRIKEPQQGQFGEQAAQKIMYF